MNPAVPFSVLNYAAGASRVRLTRTAGHLAGLLRAPPRWCCSVTP